MRGEFGAIQSSGYLCNVSLTASEIQFPYKQQNRKRLVHAIKDNKRCRFFLKLAY
jgi:hypothetical protein